MILMHRWHFAKVRCFLFAVLLAELATRFRDSAHWKHLAGMRDASVKLASLNSSHCSLVTAPAPTCEHQVPQIRDFCCREAHYTRRRIKKIKTKLEPQRGYFEVDVLNIWQRMLTGSGCDQFTCLRFVPLIAHEAFCDAAANVSVQRQSYVEDERLVHPKAIWRDKPPPGLHLRSWRTCKRHSKQPDKCIHSPSWPWAKSMNRCMPNRQRDLPKLARQVSFTSAHLRRSGKKM